MILYVAAPSTNWQTARNVQRQLVAAGHTITVDWTEEVQQYLSSGVMVDEPEALAMRDVLAVHNAQAMVWLGGSPTKGAWVELGLALAWNKPVVALAKPKPDEIFLFVPQVLVVSSIPELLETLRKLDPQTMLGKLNASPCPGC